MVNSAYKFAAAPRIPTKDAAIDIGTISLAVGVYCTLQRSIQKQLNGYIEIIRWKHSLAFVRHTVPAGVSPIVQRLRAESTVPPVEA